MTFLQHYDAPLGGILLELEHTDMTGFFVPKKGAAL